MTDNTILSGRSDRKCALTAMQTGVSVMPFASLAKVFPVQGQMTRASKGMVGPNGSAAGTVRMAGRPQMASTRETRLVAEPKRVSVT